jgi:hypothetical protein
MYRYEKLKQPVANARAYFLVNINYNNMVSISQLTTKGAEQARL